MKKFKSKNIKDFTNGIVFAMQFLINGHNETSMAKELLKESGLTLDDIEKYCDVVIYLKIKKVLEKNNE